MGTVTASDVMAVVKTVAEIERLEEVFFENVLLHVEDKKCPKWAEKCWGEINPYFVLCWDNPGSGHRACQLIVPLVSSEKGNPITPTSYYETFVHPVMGYKLYQRLGVYFPTLDQYAVRKARIDICKWIDQVDLVDKALPRPY